MGEAEKVRYFLEDPIANYERLKTDLQILKLDLQRSVFNLLEVAFVPFR
jgi:hypothetical protein